MNKSDHTTNRRRLQRTDDITYTPGMHPTPPTLSIDDLMIFKDLWLELGPDALYILLMTYNTGKRSIPAWCLESGLGESLPRIEAAVAMLADQGYVTIKDGE